MDQERKGELAIFLEALLWSLFPIITILSFQEISPLMSLAWSLVFATIFFGIVVIARKKWHELMDRNVLQDAALSAFFINVLYYLLLFYGLRHTSAGNASLIGLTEIVFGFLFFNLVLKEHFRKSHLGGMALIAIGAIIVLSPNINRLNSGDLMVLLACFFTPFGNYFQRRARKKASSESIMFIRSVFGTIAVFGLAVFLGENPLAVDLKSAWLFLAINGGLMLGLSKILWLEGIHRMNVAKASSLSSISPLMTLLFAWLILGDLPTGFQLLACIPMFFGVILLGRKSFRQ